MWLSLSRWLRSTYSLCIRLIIFTNKKSARKEKKISKRKKSTQTHTQHTIRNNRAVRDTSVWLRDEKSNRQKGQKSTHIKRFAFCIRKEITYEEKKCYLLQQIWLQFVHLSSNRNCERVFYTYMVFSIREFCTWFCVCSRTVSIDCVSSWLLLLAIYFFFASLRLLFENNKSQDKKSFVTVCDQVKIQKSNSEKEEEKTNYFLLGIISSRVVNEKKRKRYLRYI